ncbi:hypothetical protein Pmani_021478 [Petrolisthes manimaculis]|uniref:C2H2-type domain-containing protein n=1 Tax=Petrolisthes manimaculis TaxID=1843537 RepID=A0AAE1PDT0_9EUCA|nr:hypothetical protein Pmani_021478 [Petrolisthes manimaculis]
MMPGYHGDGDGGGGGGGGGGDRYRGRGRGGFWGKRDGGGGGGRGYSHRGGGGGGGGRYGGDRHRWSDGGGGGGGGREGSSRGYKDYNQYNPRYRDGPSTSQSINPWQSGSGMSSRGGGGGGGGGKRPGMEATELLRSLSEFGHISSKESRIAIDILKSVLGSDSAGSSRDGWDGPPARKMRRMDWGGAGRSSPPLHKYRDRPYVNRRNQDYRGRGRPRLDYRKLTHSQLKEMEMARLEMPRPEKKEVKDQGKKSSGGKRVREGNEEEKEEEEGKEEGAARSGSPVQEGKQSGSESGKEKDAETREKKTDEAYPDSQNFFPRSALKCHMCDMVKFPNTKAYLSHLGGKNHELITQTFHSRCAATIEVLMAESKLACKRQPKKNTSGSRRCFKCECMISSSLQEHCKTTEHTLVSRYLDVKCCGNSYNRANAEEHRLSLRHLKNHLNLEEVRKENERKEMDKKVEELLKEDITSGENKGLDEIQEDEKKVSDEKKKEEKKTEEESKDILVTEDTDITEKLDKTEEAEEKAVEKIEQDAEKDSKVDEKKEEDVEIKEEKIPEDEKKPLDEEKEKTPEEKQKEKEEQERREAAAEEAFHSEVLSLWEQHHCQNTVVEKGEEEEDKETEKDSLPVTTLPPYDPDQPIGLEYLYKEVQYRCDVCLSVLRSAHHAEYHFRSTDHYHAMTRLLTLQVEEEMEKKKQQEEEAARRRREAERDDGDERRRDDEDDLHNMETVDEAGEDIDLETAICESATVTSTKIQAKNQGGKGKSIDKLDSKSSTSKKEGITEDMEEENMNDKGKKGDERQGLAEEDEDMHYILEEGKEVADVDEEEQEHVGGEEHGDNEDEEHGDEDHVEDEEHGDEDEERRAMDEEHGEGEDEEYYEEHPEEFDAEDDGEMEDSGIGRSYMERVDDEDEEDME